MGYWISLVSLVERMCGMAKSNPELTKDFLKQYARESKDLLSAEVFSSPGHFAGEAEFIQMIEDGYRNGDRHFTFEIKPAECALIVVDLQEDFVDPGKPMCVPEAYRQIPRVKSLIAGCRELGVPVVFTEHTIAEDCAGSYYEYWDDIADGATKEGAPNTAVYHELAPLHGERVIRTKHSYDSFAGTDLDYVLRDRGVKTVIICGTLTNFCCEATARGAFSLHYNVVFGSDVTATQSAFAHEATLRTMRYGYARVLDHRMILKLMRDGDDMNAEARTRRDNQRRHKQ
jgi:nicotinamidase-related amidase